MSAWHAVAAVNEIAPGQGKEVVAGDRIIAIFHTKEGQFLALDGVCPHAGGPLGKGCLNGTTVTCPWHGWQFDVTTGCHKLTPTIRQTTFAVRVEQDRVYVEIPES